MTKLISIITLTVIVVAIASDWDNIVHEIEINNSYADCIAYNRTLETTE